MNKYFKKKRNVAVLATIALVAVFGCTKNDEKKEMKEGEKQKVTINVQIVQNDWPEANAPAKKK